LQVELRRVEETLVARIDSIEKRLDVLEAEVRELKEKLKA